jgi:hypothetical protein
LGGWLFEGLNQKWQTLFQGMVIKTRNTLEEIDSVAILVPASSINLLRSSYKVPDVLSNFNQI